MSGGVLVLAATPIGDPRDAAPRLADELRLADVVAAEDTRRLRRLCQDLDVDPDRPGASRYHEHNEAERTPELVERLREGARVLVVTDAGMPSVSDPGYRLVSAAVGIDVPGHRRPRAVRGAHGARRLRSAGRPVLLRGVPPPQAGGADAGPRGAGRPSPAPWCSSRRRTGWPCTLSAMAEAFGADRRAAVCRELTKTYEEVRRGSLSELAAWAADGVRGEVTLVVAGSSGPVADLASQLEGIRERVAEGERLKDVCADVAAATGLSKKALYDAAVAAPPRLTPGAAVRASRWSPGTHVDQSRGSRRPGRCTPGGRPTPPFTAAGHLLTLVRSSCGHPPLRSGPPRPGPASDTWSPMSRATHASPRRARGGGGLRVRRGAGRGRRAPRPAPPGSTTPTPGWPSASPSPACASTRPRCRGSPTPTTAPASPGPPGYDASVDYVVQQLEAAGYTPDVQPFVFTTFVSLAPPCRAGVAGPRRPGDQRDPQLLRQRRRHRRRSPRCPGRRSTRRRAATPPTSPASRSAGSPWSAVAAAPSRTKAQNAYAAGASAVVIANNAAGDLNGTLGEGFALDIPVTSVTQAVGAELGRDAGPHPARGDLDASAARRRPTTCSPRPAAATTATSSWPARTSTRSTPGRASTTTAPARRPCSRSPSRWPRSTRSTRCASPGGAPRSPAWSARPATSRA